MHTYTATYNSISAQSTAHGWGGFALCACSLDASCTPDGRDTQQGRRPRLMRVQRTTVPRVSRTSKHIRTHRVLHNERALVWSMRATDAQQQKTLQNLLAAKGGRQRSIKHKTHPLLRCTLTRLAMCAAMQAWLSLADLCLYPAPPAGAARALVKHH